MNGLTGVLLLADLAGTAAAVVWAYRVDPPDGTPRDLARQDLRQVRVAEAVVDGTLLAFIILGRSSLGLLSLFGLVSVALVAGRATRIALAFHLLGDPVASRLEGRAIALATTLTVSVPLIVVLAAADRSHGRTPAHRDSDLFGVRVLSREESVPTRVLPHPPAAADAGLPDGIAVPVAKYHLDSTAGTVLLLVRYEVTCQPAVVLLAAETGEIVDVAVVYRPSSLTRMPDGSLRGTATPTTDPTAVPTGTPTDTPTGTPTSTPSPPPSPLPASVCRSATTYGLAVYSSVRVVLPPDLFPPGQSAADVRDTGAGGQARSVR